MSDREIVEYYGQIWDNVKHMKKFIKELRNRYEEEEQNVRTSRKNSN